jgi:excisionase family DNA binding protein
MATATKLGIVPANLEPIRPELAEALTQARILDVEELPRFLGDLEVVRATAMGRLMCPDSQAPPDESVGVDEAARRLGVSVDYVYRHWKTFKFARQEGRKILFSSNAIDEHLKKAR